MGQGAWINECRVLCESFTAEVSALHLDPESNQEEDLKPLSILSLSDGEVIDFSYSQGAKSALNGLSQDFGSIDEAIRYANGEDEGKLATTTDPLKVSSTKRGYRIRSVGSR